ncbi:Hsp70 family protein [Psychrobacter sp. FDAARGOS_221]|uniref:Hsp70 family protein n=1 Tax=Psychrobacter sp. FDAARGOS_221 TaxID=1975705 RepID=UPI000BB580A4|nr:molecular chaperone HscC [Psychrobacter sp. FDAARGOS_221]PNK61186.1 molecular chaperone HscC [Psychrobacter sp. FDAARGOS_221]
MSSTSSPIIGIDLGTTNSLVAVWQDDSATLIPNALGRPLTPSVVSVDSDGSILVGQAAKERLISHPHQTASVFKRFMGSQKVYRLNLAPGQGQHKFSPEELSCLLLSTLKADAEAYLNCPVTDAVITVPAYFNDHQRQATKNAAQLAGLNVRRLLNEPTAAAMAYGLHESGDDRKFLVLDLGGGTFDVTLLELFSGIMEVRASAGDNTLGGEDFTQILIDGFIAHQQSIDPKLNADFWRPHLPLLYAVAENGKRELSSNNSTTLRLTIDDTAYEWQVTASDYEALAEPLLQRFRQPIERAVRDAKLRIKELDDVVLVGGATRMPLFRQLMTRLLGRFPSVGLNPDETIAIGAAIQAGLVAEDAALDDVILTDVSPYSLGVDTSIELGNHQYQHGVFAPIIERNTVIPASKVHTFYPVDDRQTEVQFNIYQGEARLTQDNIKIGEMSIKLPAQYRGKAKQLPIDVRFSYDVNGLLEVDIDVEGSDKQYNLVIQNGAKHIDEAEMQRSRQKLSQLKIHPRDQAENRNLLARAERLYTQRLGFEREQLARLIGWYESVLDGQDAIKIRQANSELQNSLDQFEKDEWF